MKELRIQITPQEYNELRYEADCLGISLKQLVHDRSVGLAPEDAPLNAAKIISDEISQYREVLNQIIKRETTADIRLYEDDLIRLQLIMEHIEAMVATYILQAIKVVKGHGNIAIHTD